MLHTTLNLLKRAGACGQKVGCGKGYDKLRASLPKDWKKNTPIPLTTVLDSNGLDDALWCLQAVLPEESGQRDKLARLLACDWAPLPELAAARKVARDAAWAAWATARAARDAAWAAERRWQAERLSERLLGKRD